MKTFEQFKAVTMAEGFDEVLTREWGANHETPVHEHPFEAVSYTHLTLPTILLV